MNFGYFYRFIALAAPRVILRCRAIPVRSFYRTDLALSCNCLAPHTYGKTCQTPRVFGTGCKVLQTVIYNLDM